MQLPETPLPETGRMHAPGGQERYGRGYLATCVGLLWLAGVGTRLTIFAVPPLIPAIHADLGMTETQVGILAGLPVVLFAFAAVPGSLLIARFGALATVIGGLVLTALGSGLRGAADTLIQFYLATVVTGFGVAVMHPAMPVLARAWLPDRIGFATAVYANGLLVGEILPVWLMVPLVLPLVGGSWRLGSVAWAIPCLVIAVALLAAPRNPAGASAPQQPRLWWPQWNSGLMWRLGLMLGAVNATYFSSNHFLPDFLTDTGRADLIGPALVSLNVGQLPGSFLLLWLAGRLERRPAAYLAFAALIILGAIGVMVGDAPVVIFCAGLLGFCAASVLILIFALPPILCRQEDVPRMAAGMFTISYSYAVIVPIVSGLIWDATGVPAVVFVPIAISALLMAALSATLNLGTRTHVAA